MSVVIWALAASNVQAALQAGCTQSGATVTCSYATQGQQASFAVPVGVTSLSVTAVGGTGGTPLPAGLPQRGGPGAIVAGSLSLSPGSVLSIQVAGNGASHQGGTSAAGAGGGGAGGPGAGGGGGASSVSSSSELLVVAAGGGGGGGFGYDAVTVFGTPGGLGGAAGADGTDGWANGTGISAGGGGAGTSAAGGYGGSGGTGTVVNGNPGAAGSDGAGGAGGGGAIYAGAGGGGGGGGGGGLYGGGGGGQGAAGAIVNGIRTADGGGGGGGGSSLVPPGGSLGTNSAPNPARPSVVISYNVAVEPPTPHLTAVSQSHARWRLGNGLPKVATIARVRKPPVGTTFRFKLSQAAAVRFAFTQSRLGRPVGGRCLAATATNRRKRRCWRTVTAGSFTYSAEAGAYTVHFQGRTSRSKRLKPGRYTLVISATNSAGSTMARLKFRIVG